MAGVRAQRAVRRRRKPSRTVQVTGHKKVTGSLKAARILAKHHGGGSGSGGDDGGGGGSAASDLARRLREAAQIIADQARVNAGWSRKIPPSIKVSGSATISISSSAGPAYPNEIPGVRHPTFGHRPWVTNAHRPFLAPAADERADAAAEQFAKVIDDWAAEYGFK